MSGMDQSRQISKESDSSKVQRLKLHRALSLTELENNVIMVNSIAQSLGPVQAAITARNCLIQGDGYFFTKDEEMAYEMYSRYVQLIKFINGLPPDTTNHSLSVLNTENLEQVERKIQKLEDSLSSRYLINSLYYTISCEELKDAMRTQASKLMIVDMQTDENYQKGRISFPVICHFPANKCDSYADFVKFDYLASGSKYIWNSRDTKSVIVFYGETTKFTSMISGSMMRFMQEYLSSRQRSYFFLDGGFKKWLEMYPKDIYPIPSGINPTPSSSQSSQIVITRIQSLNPNGPKQTLILNKRTSECNQTSFQVVTPQQAPTPQLSLQEKKEKLMNELLEIEGKIAAEEAKKIEEVKKQLEEFEKSKANRTKVNEEFVRKMNDLRRQGESSNDGSAAKKSRI